MFVGSELAGQRAAIVMNLVQSARMCGQEPWAYLRDVLLRLPRISTAASRTYCRIVGSLPNTPVRPRQGGPTGRSRSFSWPPWNS